MVLEIKHYTINKHEKKRTKKQINLLTTSVSNVSINVKEKLKVNKK